MFQSHQTLCHHGQWNSIILSRWHVLWQCPFAMFYQLYVSLKNSVEVLHFTLSTSQEVFISIDTHNSRGKLCTQRSFVAAFGSVNFRPSWAILKASFKLLTSCYSRSHGHSLSKDVLLSHPSALCPSIVFGQEEQWIEVKLGHTSMLEVFRFG